MRHTQLALVVLTLALCIILTAPYCHHPFNDCILGLRSSSNRLHAELPPQSAAISSRSPSTDSTSGSRPLPRPPTKQRASSSSFNARHINKVIVEAFSKPNFTDSDIERLRLFLLDSTGRMNQVNAITLMHRCGKHKRDIFSFVSIDVLIRLLNVRTGIASSQGIANAIYSLQVTCTLILLTAQHPLTYNFVTYSLVHRSLLSPRDSLSSHTPSLTLVIQCGQFLWSR